MKTFLVWILISVSNDGTVDYSPPLREYKDCVKMQAMVQKLNEGRYRPTDCIQVDMVSAIANPTK